MIPVQKHMRAQAGFTLVELAIVMIIIGLLIAGVLKGQALIGNAKVTAQVAQIKSIDAATSTFKDMYAALPGDMLNATNRLPNCAAAPCTRCWQWRWDHWSRHLERGRRATEAAHLFRASERCRSDDRHQSVRTASGLGRCNSQRRKINGGLHVGTSAGGAVPNNGLGIAAGNVMGGLYLASA